MKKLAILSSNIRWSVLFTALYVLLNIWLLWYMFFDGGYDVREILRVFREEETRYELVRVAYRITISRDPQSKYWKLRTWRNTTKLLFYEDLLFVLKIRPEREWEGW